MNIVILGAPGAGKGMISDYLIKNYGFLQISTGNILRENVAGRTELGIIAQKYMNRGELVPDDLVIGMLKNVVLGTKAEFIFDGFPRTLNQALALDDICKIDLVLFVDVQKDVVIKRALGRRVCAKCQRTYKIANYKKSICEDCGGELIQRADDTEEVIEKRFETFYKQTASLKDFYQNKNILKVINNSNSIEETYENVAKAVEDFRRKQ